MNIKKYKYYRVLNIDDIARRDSIGNLYYYGYMNSLDPVFKRDWSNNKKIIYKTPLENGIGIMTYDTNQIIRNISCFKTFRGNLMEVSKRYTSFKNTKRSDNKH